jgi:hypothetical protein
VAESSLLYGKADFQEDVRSCLSLLVYDNNSLGVPNTFRQAALYHASRSDRCEQDRVMVGSTLPTPTFSCGGDDTHSVGGGGYTSSNL